MLIYLGARYEVHTTVCLRTLTVYKEHRGKGQRIAYQIPISVMQKFLSDFDTTREHELNKKAITPEQSATIRAEVREAVKFCEECEAPLDSESYSAFCKECYHYNGYPHARYPE
jgi:hypothetical protein